MAQIVELVQRGVFLELPDEVARDASSLTRLMADRVTDAVLALGLFEEAWTAMWARMDQEREGRREAWEREREAERVREQELAGQDPPPEGAAWPDPAYREWEDVIREWARRDVVRQKWAAGELPEGYQSRLPTLHARSFVLALAQLARALGVLAELDTGDAKEEIAGARDAFFASLPTLVPVRDSIEHAEDRMRSLGRFERPLTLQPIMNSMIHAPGGGALVSDSLNGNLYGCTIEDGSYAEVAVSDATVEVARAAVQRVLDALPWKDHGHAIRHYTPHS